jgi:hypothetical protein
MKDNEPVGSLLKDGMFWLSCIVIPFIIATVMALLINEDFDNDISSATSINTANYILEYFKVPFLIMGLSFPFSAIFIAHHRSKQQDQIYKQQLVAYTSQEENYKAEKTEDRRIHYLGLYKDFEKKYKEVVEKHSHIADLLQLNHIVSVRSLFQSVITTDANFNIKWPQAYEHHYRAAENLKGEIYKLNEASEDSNEQQLLHTVKVYILSARRAGLIQGEAFSKLSIRTVLDHLGLISKILGDFLPVIAGINYVSFKREEVQLLNKKLKESDVTILDCSEFLSMTFHIPREKSPQLSRR